MRCSVYYYCPFGASQSLLMLIHQVFCCSDIRKCLYLSVTANFGKGCSVYYYCPFGTSQSLPMLIHQPFCCFDVGNCLFTCNWCTPRRSVVKIHSLFSDNGKHLSSNVNCSSDRKTWPCRVYTKASFILRVTLGSPVAEAVFAVLHLGRIEEM